MNGLPLNLWILRGGGFHQMLCRSLLCLPFALLPNMLRENFIPFLADVDVCASDAHKCRKDAMCSNTEFAFECICSFKSAIKALVCQLPPPTLLKVANYAFSRYSMCLKMMAREQKKQTKCVLLYSLTPALGPAIHSNEINGNNVNKTSCY